MRLVHLLLVAALGFSTLTATGGAAERAALRTAIDSIRRADLQRHVETLADDTFEGRAGGSRGGRAAGVYLSKELARVGLEPAGSDGSWFQPFRGTHRNVLGAIEGNDPHLKMECIVVGAHYDHVGYGTPRNSYGPYGYIHNGADDNASGVAALIEVAEAFQAAELTPRRSILFAFWDGEEQGLLGSKHWMQQPTVPLDEVRLGINLDMIGRLRDEQLEVWGTRTARGLRRLVGVQSAGAGLQLSFHNEIKPESDHYSFFEYNIPFLMFHTGKHPDYHRPSDDSHKINQEGVERVSRLLFDVVYELANRDQAPPFRPAAHHESPDAILRRLERPLPPRPPRFGVSWDERESPEPGLLLTRVVAGSPAETAGLRVGDRLLRFHDVEIHDGDSLRRLVLSAPREVEIELRRAGDEQPETLQVRLAGRPVRVGIAWRMDEAEPGSVLVTRVVPGSPAARAGLRVRDRIYRVGGEDFSSSDAFRSRLDAASGPTPLLIDRNGKVDVGEIDLPAIEAPAAPRS